MASHIVLDEAIVYCSGLCQCQVYIFTGLPTLAHRTLISKYASYMKDYCIQTLYDTNIPA